ncbi:MAG: hypothetical protein AABZ07_03080 [Nitrospirota bacterium]
MNKGLLLLLLLLSSCAPSVQHYTRIDRYLYQEQYTEADNVLEKSRNNYGLRNELLYYLDRAMVLHLAGRYAESNAFLDKAESRMEDLYTKSITSEAGAMLTNDNLLPYEGEDFEKVMVNVIGALNYVYMHQWDDALVEARKIDHKLNVFNDKYEKKNVYKEDAFARYLTGLLYEAKKEYNDAFIAYRKSYDTYQDYRHDYGTPLPPPLPKDLLRLTDSLNLDEEYNFYRNTFSDISWLSQKEIIGQGEIIFISLDGHSPIKADYFIDAPIPDSRGGIYHLRIALPKFVPQPNNLEYIDVKLIDEKGIVSSQEMFLAEDISAIAVKNLEDRIGRITARAIARATTKYLAALEIRKKVKGDPFADMLVKLGTNIYTIASEQSDKRSWQTLPAKIRMARVAAPPGSYTLVAEYYAANHRLLMKKSYPVTLMAGEKAFLSNRYLGNSH